MVIAGQRENVIPQLCVRSYHGCLKSHRGSWEHAAATTAHAGGNGGSDGHIRIDLSEKGQVAGADLSFEGNKAKLDWFQE